MIAQPRDRECRYLSRFLGPPRFLLNLINPPKPVLAILCGVLQQKERHGGHGVGDIADVPLATLPNGPEVRGFFAWIVAFARAQLIELDSYGRREPARCRFL